MLHLQHRAVSMPGWVEHDVLGAEKGCVEGEQERLPADDASREGRALC